MQRIKQDWGSIIETACRYSSIPPEFLAALIANESGGDPKAQRFEKSVYNRLFDVKNGRSERYGSLTAEILRSAQDDMLRAWATSWGLTQIMGYHVLGIGSSDLGVSEPRTPPRPEPGSVRQLTDEPRTPVLLLDPLANLQIALRLLGEFAERYQLDVRSEFAEFFRSWNTGGPYGKTADAKYVEKGLARMEVYKNL